MPQFWRPFFLCFFSLSLACGGCEDTPVDPRFDAGTEDQASDNGNSNNTNNQNDTGEDTNLPDTSTCESVCGAICCENGEECVDDQYCHPPCAGTRCGADLGICCEGANEICFAEQCLLPGNDCTQTEECELDEICEPTVGKCVPRDIVDVCEFRPPIGEFEPTLGCAWPPPVLANVPASTRVVVSPIVGNLTDDNGDGLTNTDDVPDIVFLSRPPGCCNRTGVLRIVTGECGADGFLPEVASLDSVPMINDSAPALGDLDGDGVPEIVAIKNATATSRQPEGVVAWKRVEDDGSVWEVYWEQDTYPTYDVHTRGGATVAIADLEADGNPEIIVGNVVLNGQTGALKWDGVVESASSGGIGNNAFLGPSSSVGDIDLDGELEVAAGNTLYDADGSVLWTYEYTTDNSPCGGGLPCDGFTAMANFDDDDEGEVVIIRRGEVFIINHDGTLLWTMPIIKDDCANNESGPPTVADFDGDGRPEIGTAAADFYTVLDMDCDADPVPDGCAARGVLWATANEDCSSRVTASSVFDFEGDGKAEMVYADEDTFRIFDGTDGAILFEDDTHSSNTRIEMPLVADVDNDGNSEVVIPSDTAQSIKVWEDGSDNWVRTRRIWNQHSYHVSNVNEDGTIPVGEPPNWLNSRLNNFRQNIQPGGIFDAPNLVVRDLQARGIGCGESTEVEVRATIANEGALGIPAGVPIRIFARHNGAPTIIYDDVTMTRLLPGQFEVVSANWTVPAQFITDGFTLHAIIDPDMTVNECLEDDNEQIVDSSDIVFSAPDLIVEEMTIDDATCSITATAEITVTVKNDGTQPVPVNVPIVVRATYGGSGELVGTVRTSMVMQPGESETFALTWNVSDNGFNQDFTVIATVDPNGEVYECDQQNSGEVDGDCKVAM